MSNESPTPPTAASPKPAGRCPICRRPAAEAMRPFCSPRCRDVDLHRWLSGSYVIPATEGDEEDVE
ncbi:DNA gyrase inhibitor YacG [Bradyrhizobium aeschynomenes]|uniref:DNA gyrase inhibitor YacG n=1 Tax=Bradyrhizobium aeschynomenes TaxID=2734909 RepID=UPI0015554A8D|nr:DNA gyrase inhibitor YacG [Bradyrhizobium aeschynomenes]NPV24248.1 DNA gyrase inhibitor YacG [Bradyrhizobium aeschynomenes]